jgi:predicted nucleic-acid-binding protein
MTGLDTNVLVRYLVADDPRQTAAAAAAIRDRCTIREPGFVNLIVLCELVWVLDSVYDYSRDSIAAAVDALCQSPQLSIERGDLVKMALGAYRTSRADLSDCLVAVANMEAGCTLTLTFDRAAATVSGFDLLS